MNSVTEIFQKYRVCSRLIWNLFFWLDPDLANWDGRDQFETIKRQLFKTLVIEKLSLKDEDARFRVVPKIETGTPIKIEQPRKGDLNRYWDHPISLLKPSDAFLEFIDYFDWDPIGCLDFRYVRARIQNFPSQPELVSREVLLDADYAEIWIISASK